MRGISLRLRNLFSLPAFQRADSVMEEAARLRLAPQSAGEHGRAEFLRRRVERPRLADMAEDFGMLAAELERCFGGTGTLPTRAQLRAVLRTDLEKAIAAHGGASAVSKKMGWRLAYQASHRLNLFLARPLRRLNSMAQILHLKHMNCLLGCA